MPWQSFIPWSNSLKTRACRQLIHHYLGVFFQEKLSLDQLSIDLFSGRSQVKDVILNLNALNESLTNNNIPLEVVKAYVGEINLSIPWTSLLRDNSLLDIKDLEITVRPKQTNDQKLADASFELSSMFNSMNTSMLIAQECLKNETEEDTTYQGLETFAATLDSILARVRVTLTDTVIRLEHLINNGDHGVAFEIRIKKFEYFDSEATSIDMTVPRDSNLIRPTVFTNKNFVLSGVTLYTDEFSIFKNSSSMIDSSELSLSNRLIADSMMSSVLTNSSSGMMTTTGGNTRMVGYESFDPVLCLTISGKQDIRLKLKQSEQIFGPKVEIEAHCGSVNCLLTPKQLQSLIILLTAYQKAALHSTSDPTLYNSSTANNRPMTEDDYKRIEQNAAEEIRKKNCQFSAQQYDNDNYHYSDVDNTADPSESMFCSVEGMSTSIDLVSSYTSSRPDSASISSHPRRRSSPHHHSSSNQPVIDKAHLKESAKRLFEQGRSIISTKCRLQFNFISLCLLHRDIQTNSTSLREYSDIYFSNISTINTSGILDDRQINEYRLKYSQACLKDHLLLIGKPLIIDFIQQSAENCLCLDLDIRFSSVDLCECLQPENTNIQPSTTNETNQMIFNRLLSFIRPSETNFDSFSSFQVPYNSIQSSVQISITNFDINQTKKKKSSNAFNRSLAALRPFSDINIRLGSCQIDFDISIIDRIYSIINACQNSSTTNKSSNNSLSMLAVSSPGCILNLRFPIADLQPLNKRRPWWIQGVHKEILILDFKQIHFQSNFNNDESTALTITSESIQVYYMTNINSERSHIGQLSSSNGEVIKMIINLNNLKDLLINQLNPSMTDTLFDSIFCRLPTNDNKLPLKHKNTLNDNRQILEVADTNTINEFISSCSQETKLNLHIIIPYILLYVSDQVFLETIYNRFVNNLFMWESSVPMNNDSSNQMFLTANNLNRRLINSYGNTSSEQINDQAFQLCRSMNKHFTAHSSDDDDDQIFSDEDDDNEGQITPKLSKKKGPHEFVIQLNVHNIHLALNAPLGEKNSKESRTTTSNIGEFRIDGQGLTLAFVNGYQGDENLEYFCLLSQSVSLQHNGHGTVMKPNISLNEVISRSLPELITRCPSDAFSKYNNNATMIRSAYEIRTTGNRLDGKQKIIRGSFTIEGAMLHQKIVPKSESWLLQLIELFDLTDEDIPGYIPTTSLLEWHLEFRHCGIHYRPLYFDTKCFVAIDSLTLTNTFVKNSKTTLLELNLDDWAIYLSKQKRDRYKIDLLNDYICIISGGAFEIKLCFNEPVENTPITNPLVDIRIACNMIHIRSCSDSANALIELLKYVLTDGDLQQPTTNETSRSSTPIERKRNDRPVRILNDDTMNNEQLTIDDTSNQMLLIEDAMKPIGSLNNSVIQSEDDENILSNSHSSDIECGSVFSSSSYSKDDDSLFSNKRQTKNHGENNGGFEFIDREIGMCRPPKNGICEVHVLSETPIQIHENHFAKPLERNDILNAPAHLPVPTLKFSIRQISIVWHIYGGSDFAIPKPNDSHEQPVQLNINESVRFTLTSNSSPPTQEKAGGRLYSSYDTTRLPRHERGGPCRDLRTSMEFSISKARCQYETYSEQEKASSRFVFAIHEFEIRDRLLARSEINKFLYLYTTEAAPRRTHADMLVVKILHTKPEGYIMKAPNEEFENEIDSKSSSEPLECEIKVSLQPLRINIDQDTLVFMRNFFINLTNNRETSTPIPVKYVLVIEQNSNNINNEYPSSSLDSDLSTSPSSRYISSSSSPTLNTPITNDTLQSSNSSPSVFIKHFVFSPACHIRIDYHGKLRSEQLFEAGPLLNLLIGLAQLAKVDIYLKRISYKSGLLGYEKLFKFLLNEWLNDIRPTDVIKGIVPLSSISQIVIGIKDLFYLPIDQYRRDGRVFLGIQRGASSFTTSTALALIELSSQLVRCAHLAALLCFELVSSSTTLPDGSISSLSSTQTIMVRNRPPPNDIREGVTYAVNVIRQSFNTTSHQLKTEAQLGRRRKGILGVVGGLLRQMPSVAIQPIVTTTKAAENVLVGVRNQIDRDKRNDDKEKYRSE
ncbi:unnamed protein product [Rotaria sordida]|uniref:Autophagy-related protein 2 n=1 Tax=Rotaria sordida TaxID=392033 RepID=A0A818ZCJ8_9BILA|nr:unnamed protein product [Rotaria sordida]